MAHKGAQKDRYPIMTGVVKSVDADAMTCKVELTADAEGKGTDGVTMNVSLANVKGVFGIPTEGADCLVMEVDGKGRLELLKASEYTKVVITASALVELNGNSLGGLTKTPVLQTELNKTNALLTALIGVINGAPIPEPGSGAASALQALLKAALTGQVLGDYSGIENTKVKHG